MGRTQRTVLLACMLVTFVTGSIHCFSIFLTPLESMLDRPRAEVSLFYSVALAFLTGAVLAGHRIYHRFNPASMIFLSCLVAGTGILLSASTRNWWVVLFGYSILFGTANGIAYGYVLQLSGRAIPNHRGFAMALVTAAYAAGSVLFSFLLAWLIDTATMQFAFITLGLTIIFGGIASALIIHGTGAAYSPAGAVIPDTLQETRIDNCLVFGLWTTYGFAVLAGLMAIGHAAGMVQSLGGSYRAATWGSALIGIGSALGGYFIGRIIKRQNINFWLVALPLLSTLSLVLLVFTATPFIATGLLCITGFAYGALIAVYPYSISEFFGEQLGPGVYGKVFTAWGLAGLAGPWLAGELYDLNRDYTASLIVSALFGVASAVCYRLLSRKYALFAAQVQT